MSKPLPFPGRVAEALRRSTVQVKTEANESGGLGSGVMLSGDSILTNAHVARGSGITIECWDGTPATAIAIRSDSRRDLCLLQCSTNLSGVPVTFADSDRLQSGTPVFAVGNPLGFIGAVSRGVIKSVGPVAYRSPLLRQSWVCAWLRLAPGNSGGPLADFSGNVIGINTMVISGGLALAVPSASVQSFLKSPGLILGVTIRPVRLPSRETALMILELARDGAAEAASLLPGDLLVSANARKLHSPDDLQRSMDEAPSGRLHLTFRRGNHPNARQVTVQLQPMRLHKAA